MSRAAERRARFVEGRRVRVGGGVAERVWKKDVDASRREVRWRDVRDGLAVVGSGAEARSRAGERRRIVRRWWSEEYMPESQNVFHKRGSLSCGSVACCYSLLFATCAGRLARRLRKSAWALRIHITHPPALPSETPRCSASSSRATSNLSTTRCALIMPTSRRSVSGHASLASESQHEAW